MYDTKTISKNDIFNVLVNDLNVLANKVDRLKSKLSIVSGNGTGDLINDINKSLKQTMDHFFIQEYEVERTLEKWLTLKRDLELARLVQHTIFPHESLYFQDYEFSGYTRAARTLGGDYFTYGFSEDGVYAAIGDVSGKGIANALITVIFDTHLKQFFQKNTSLHEMLLSLNQLFVQMITEFVALDNKFMTFLIFKFDGNKLDYAGAGHEHILIYRAETKKIEKIKTGGVAFGIITDFFGSFNFGSIQLNPGDCILTYSDGITDARNNEHELYGLPRLMKSFNDNADKTLNEVLQIISHDVDSFQQSHDQYDDITLLAIKRNFHK